MTSPSSRHETGHSKPQHWDNPERWDAEGGRRGVRVGGHMYTHGRFMSIYGKNHHNIVKLLASDLKKNNFLKKFMAQILAAPLGIEILPPNSRWRSVTRGGARRPRAAGPAQLCPVRCTLWTGAQAPLSMAFAGQEHWSGLAISSSRGSS